MMDQLYIALHNRLFTKLTDSAMAIFGLPGLLWVDRENQQFEKILAEEGHEMLPIRFPAITIGLGPIEWRNTGGKGMQQAENAVITFRIAYENYADSYQTQQRDGFTTGFSAGFATGMISGSGNQETALKDYRFLDQVHTALQGFAPLGNAYLERTASRYDDDYRNVIVHELDYRLQLSEEIVRDVTNVVLADLCPIPSLPTPPAWSPSIAYQPGQKVTFNELMYVCILETVAGTQPSDQTYWYTYYNDYLYIIR